MFALIFPGWLTMKLFQKCYPGAPLHHVLLLRRFIRFSSTLSNSSKSSLSACVRQPVIWVSSHFSCLRNSLVIIVASTL